MLNLVLLLVASAAPADVAVRVRTLDGRELSGSLVQLSDDTVSVSTPQGVASFAADELLRVVQNLEEPPRRTSPQRIVVVDLIDGSRLLATEYTSERARATVLFSSGEPARVPTRSIKTVRLKAPQPALDSEWQAIVERPATADRIAIRKTTDVEAGPQSPGTDVVLDQVDGVLGDVAPERVGFQFDGTDVDISTEKIEGLIYHHPRVRRLPDAVCEVEDRSGSKWFARGLQLKEQVLAITTPAGVRYSLPLEELAAIDYSVGNLDYLDELTFETVQFRPNVRSPATPDSVAGWFRPRLFSDGPDPACSRGLTVHSHTELTYRLAQNYQRFRATVGIDRRYRSQGQVRLMVKGNNRTLFDQEIRGTDEPAELEIDLRGVRRLSIIVDFGEDGSDQGDHLNFCNARLTK